MAHIAGHIDPRVDQALIEAGLTGGQLPERRNPRPSPSLFDSTAQNLFGEINMRAGGRAGDLLGTLFGGLLPPSKKQQEAFAQLKKERAQKLERARSGAVSEFAAASGLSTPASRSAALASPELARSLEATARNEPGGRPSLNALAERAVLQQLQSGQAQTKAGRANLPLHIQQSIDETERNAAAQNITNRRQFISDVEGNPALDKSVASLVAANQLEAVLAGDFTALDLTTAAVLFTQVIEPGLAVREDDRMAFTRGADSGFQTLKNIANQFALGEISADQAAANVRATLFSIMRTPAQRLTKSLEFWQSVGLDIPGVKGGDVMGAIGLTPELQESIARFSLTPGQINP